MLDAPDSDDDVVDIDEEEEVNAGGIIEMDDDVSDHGSNQVQDWAALDFSIVRNAALRKVSTCLCSLF